MHRLGPGAVVGHRREGPCVRGEWRRGDQPRAAPSRRRPRGTGGGATGVAGPMTMAVGPAREGTAGVWFRRDLRLHDHAALAAALPYNRMLCVIVLDDRLLHGRYSSPNREWFLRQSLESLTSE